MVDKFHARHLTHVALKSKTTEAVAHFVRLAMAARGFNQSDLAYRSGVSNAHLSEILRLRAAPTTETIDKLAAGLGVAPSDLLMGKAAPVLNAMKPTSSDPSLRERKPIQWQADNAELGARLRKAMAELGVNGNRLAKATGVTRQAIHLAVRGSTKQLSPVVLLALSNYLHVRPQWLATGEPPMHAAALSPRNAEPRRQVSESHEPPINEAKHLRSILAAKLRRAIQAGETQMSLGIKAGISQQHIGRLLKAESAATIDCLPGLAKALGSEPWELLLDDEEQRRRILARLIGQRDNETPG